MTALFNTKANGTYSVFVTIVVGVGLLVELSVTVVVGVRVFV